jgi:PAS domain S-box-containing protein
MAESGKTHQPHDFYYRILLSGREKILHAKGEVVVDDHGEAVQMFGTLQDVTQQKLEERELNEKQNFIQKIADVTPSLIAAYNIQTGKYIFVNGALRKLLGYEPEDILREGTSFFMNLMHPDDIASTMQKNSRAIERANSAMQAEGHEFTEEFEYRMRNSKGDYRWFHTYGTVFSRDNKGMVEYVLNISMDVTEEHLLRTQIEQEKVFAEKQNEELRRSEERYHNMISEVKDYAILLLDVDGVVLNWNQGAEKIKGYKATEIIGKNFRLFYTPEDIERKRPEKLLQTAIQTGHATDEGWRVRKNGSRLWGSIVITALHDASGNLIGFTKVTRDLTERKRAEEKLKEYAEELKEKNEELERTNKELESFNYAASHDLQEPLRKIQIFSNAILTNDAPTLSSKAQEYFDRMNLAANRMQQLIEDLLTFSRTTISSGELHNADLSTLLDEALSTLRTTIEDSHAVIEKQKLPIAHVIPFQFVQLFQNLIGNSLKYRKQNIPPYIKISAKKIIAKSNIKGLVPNHKYLKITISDNGVGFEQEHAERIFDLFQRLHTKDEFPGTGIGLAICKKIMQNHHGVIVAKSKAHQGATFDTYIPHT